MKSLIFRVIIALLITVVFAGVFQVQAQQTFDPGCSTAELVSAINTANGTAEADVINLSTGCMYSFTEGDSSDTENALPTIKSEIAINGNGATIERASSAATDFRLLRVIDGNLTLTSITLSGGQVGNSSGGAIRIESGNVAVVDSIISGNTARDYGGGIHFMSGTLRMSNSTISANTANWGGGIRNSGGSLSVVNSVMTGNSAAQEGGGISSIDGTLTVINTTISGTWPRTMVVVSASTRVQGPSGIASSGAIVVKLSVTSLST